MLSQQHGKVYRAVGASAVSSERIAQKARVTMLRPFVLLFKEPIVFLFALYASIIVSLACLSSLESHSHIGFVVRNPIVSDLQVFLAVSVLNQALSLMFGAFPVVYEEIRGFTAGSAGLPFIAVAFGMLFGKFRFGVVKIIPDIVFASGIVGAVVDSVRYTVKLRANGGRPLAPEERLGICCIGGIVSVFKITIKCEGMTDDRQQLLPISMAWFAASAKSDVHWIVPVLSGVPFGCGMLLVFLGGTSYLVDTYAEVSASAMAANSFMRSLLCAIPARAQ